MSLPPDTPRPWTRKETVLHQADAIRRIDAAFSECVTSAIIDSIQKHYISARISTNPLYKHAIKDVASPEAQVHITEVIAMRCMNGGDDAPLWHGKCEARGLTEYVEKEIALLKKGLCVCEKRAREIHVGGCRYVCMAGRRRSSYRLGVR